MGDYRVNCNGCNVGGCFVITHDPHIVEKCPCQECLIKAMCSDICDKRVKYYLMIIEGKDKENEIY
jgi:hypothetical protein